jgi:large subunit ribosomal protein L29
MTKAGDLRDMAIPELESQLADTSKELYGLVNEMKRTKKSEKPHLIRLKKKERARLLTVLHQKQSANNQ